MHEPKDSKTIPLLAPMKITVGDDFDNLGQTARVHASETGSFIKSLSNIIG